MIYKTTPKNFKPKFEVVSCYVACDDKILLLHRCGGKSQGGKWGVPAGKMDLDETPRQAMTREAREETGLELEIPKLKYLQKVFVHHDDYDFVYHMFLIKFDHNPQIHVSPREHQGFCWVNPAEALRMNLVDDLGECIKMIYR